MPSFYSSFCPPLSLLRHPNNLKGKCQEVDILSIILNMGLLYFVCTIFELFKSKYFCSLYEKLDVILKILSELLLMILSFVTDFLKARLSYG